ncbi:MAG: GtrA family protein [Myxococcaceae bacterium]
MNARPNSWWMRSLACGAVATVCDYSVMLATSTLAGFAPAVSTTSGLLVGGLVGFALNRRVAFKDAGPAGPALLRYVSCFGLLMLLHGAAVTILAGRWHVPVVMAKAGADLVLLAGGQLLLLRYVVFPRNKGALSVALSGEPECPHRSRPMSSSPFSSLPKDSTRSV